MINSNTLKLLNRNGFGADIDKLESYLIDLKHIQTVSRVNVNSKYYMELNKLLKEVKPESLYFTDRTSMIESELEKNDKLFIDYVNDDYYTIFGYSDNKINDFKRYINEAPDSSIDLVSIPNILGITVKVIFINGYLYRINLIGKQYKYTDVTDVFKAKVPGFINTLAKYEVVEVRGYIVDTSHIDEPSDIKYVCNINNKIRTCTDLDDLQIVIDDVYIDSVDSDRYTQWDKFNLLDNTEFNTVTRTMIRGVDSDTLIQALKEFNYSLHDTLGTEVPIYKYNGIKIIENNSTVRDYENTFIHNLNNARENQVYTSVIKSITTSGNADDMYLKLSIVDAKCNENLYINHINIYDISSLDSKNIEIGKEIRFTVFNNNAIIL